MITGLLALSLLVMKLYPETPFAQLLHLWLVERPLKAAARLERKHLILVAIILFSGPSLAAFGSAEIAMLYAVDLSLYVDAVVVTSLSAFAASLKSGWGAFIRGAGRTLRFRPGKRSRRVRAAHKANTASNDDEPAWARVAA
jgi:hypothetical protein